MAGENREGAVEWFGWSAGELAAAAVLGIGAVAAGVAIESPRLNLAGVAGVVFAAVGISFALALWLATG